MFVWKVVPALAVGNTCVIKSSEHTPLTALYAASLFKEAGFPPGVINVLSGFGPTCGKFIGLHPDIDKMSFTGSVPIGKKIMEYSGQSNLKTVSLELGGKSPLIVCKDFKKIKTAAETACNGVFFNQGQVCCACSRVLVHEDIYDDFLKECKKIAKNRKVGDPFKKKTEQGPQNSKKQFEKIMEYIRIGKEEAKLLCGGKRIGEKGYFIEPTIFYDCHNKMKIMQEEIFGPVFGIIKFSTLEEAIEIANDTTFGLAAGIMTTLKVRKKLQAGTVWVNCYNIFDANLPFGGYKQSGSNSKDSGKLALKNYLREKAICIAV